MITFKRIAVSAILVAGLPALQAYAADTPAQKDKAEVAAIYKALSGSKDPQAEIAKLVAEGKNPDTIAEVATVVGVPVATIETAMPSVPAAQIVADVSTAQSDPAAFSPGAASGNSQGQQGQGQQGQNGNGGNNGNSGNGGGFSSGGAGGGGSAVSKS